MRGARDTFAARLMALAERHPRRAGRLALAALAASPRAGAELLAIGWALLRWERLPEAEAALEAARLAPGDGAALLRRSRALLMLRQLRGEGAALQADWERHAAQCERAGELAELARARCEQIAHLNLLGRPAEAWALALATRPLVERHGDAADLARYQHVAGVAAAGRAEFATALELLGQALDGFARLGHRAEVARASFERASVHLRREAFPAAEADLSRALHLYRRLDLPFRVALCERDQGLVARYRGEYGRAVARFVHAREAFAALGRLDRAGGCDFNLGAVAHMCGLYDLALAAYRQAQGLFTAHGDRAHALMAAGNEALVLYDLGRAAEALRLAEELLPRAQAQGDQLEQTELLVVRARAIAALGRTGEAVATLEAAHARFRELDNLPAAGECRLDLGWISLERGDLEAAAGHLRAAAQALGDRPAHSWRVHYGLGRVGERLGRQVEARGHYREAVAIVAQLRRRLASEHASSRLFALARQLHEDAMRLAVATGDAAEVLVLGEQQRGLTLDRHVRAAERPGPPPAPGAHDVHATLRASLRGDEGAAPLGAAIEAYVAALLQQRHRFDVEVGAAEPIEPERVRAALSLRHGTRWSLLAPVFTADELLLVILTPDELWMERQPYDGALRLMLERACQPRYRLEVYRDVSRLRDPQQQPWAVLAALGERLLPGRLRERLSPEHRLLVVPSGPLHMLPWAALRLGGSWLCERAEVELLPGLGFTPRAPALAPEAPALLIACDHFGDRAPPLPLAPSSLELVAGRWRGPVTRLVSEAATCAALEASSMSGDLRRYRLIHIAAHAQLGGADGLLAHIKLADADLPLDGVLRLDLDRPLVVLAACEGGAGAVLPGDEILGLGRALIAAGAGSVLASLWPVYDRGVLALLEPFYAALVAGADPAGALARAQRALCAGATADDAGAILATPLIWGGFTVTSGVAR